MRIRLRLIVYLFTLVAALTAAQGYMNDEKVGKLD